MLIGRWLTEGANVCLDARHVFRNGVETGATLRLVGGTAASTVVVRHFSRNKWANGRLYGTPRGAAGYPCHLVSVGATGSLLMESIPREAISFNAVGVVPANRPAIIGAVCWRGVLPDELSIPCWPSIRVSIRRLRRTLQRLRVLLLLPQPLLCRSDRGQRRVRTRRGLWLL